MPKNLAIDGRLLEEARKIGRHRTNRETVSAALEEYIAHRKQQEILTLFCNIEKIAREYFMRADRGRPDILELFHEDAEVYFPNAA